MRETAAITITNSNCGGGVRATFPIYGVTGAWDGGRLTATAFVSEQANARLIAVVCDGNGKQVSVKVLALQEGQTAYETGIAQTSGCTCKLMVADAATFAPLCAAWENEDSNAYDQ